jgi:rhodanese-related sulfurtransferase
MRMWKKDILRAIILVIIVTLAALVINEGRTPVFQSIADSGKITHAKGLDLSGLRLIDNWNHGGWVKVAKAETGEPKSTGESTPDNHEPQVWPIDTTTAKKFFDEGDCIFLDARETKYYEEAHIAGALSWPTDEFDSLLEKYREKIPYDQCVVAYCIGGACDESSHLATSLLVEGWKEVYLYEGGIQEWQAVGYPTETGPQKDKEPADPE